MNQPNIIISLIVLLIISFFSLAYLENSQHKISNDWFLYFENPQNNSLDFIVENFSDNEEFSWSLAIDNKIIKTEKIKVLKGSKKNVMIEKLPKGEKFIIKITHGKGGREIYKIF